MAEGQRELLKVVREDSAAQNAALMERMRDAVPATDASGPSRVVDKVNAPKQTPEQVHEEAKKHKVQ